MARDTTFHTHPAEQHDTRTLTRHLPTVARILQGLIFAVMGLNGFLYFLPVPESMPADGLAFLGALGATGYMLPLISIVQLAVGLMLLTNLFVPLAIALIAPVIVNIIGYHLFLSPALYANAIVVTILELYLAWSYRHAFRPMLAVHVEPHPQK